LGLILKNHLISVWATLFHARRWSKIDRKTTALALLLITVSAAIAGGLMMTARAAETNSTTSDTNTETTTNANGGTDDLPLWAIGEIMTGDQGFGGGPRGHGGHGGLGFMGGVGNIEVSSEYTANVNAILDADTDVQNLISEGYNVTSINPIIKNIIEADGTLTTKATTATVFLQNGTSGFATVSVDVANAKVTQIVIIARTVIDKTSS
jgi:hypothetical protein